MNPTIDPNDLILVIGWFSSATLTAFLFVGWLVHLGAALTDITNPKPAKEFRNMTLYFAASVAILVGLGALL